MNRDLPAHAQPPSGDPARAPARLLKYARGRYIALPQHTTIELIDTPTVITVPGAAYYAHGLLAWQGRYLPLVDLDRLLLAHSNASELGAPPFALVVAYQCGAGAPIEHGALACMSLPKTVEIDDASQCELPADSDLWPVLALSCFRHGNHTIPILGTARLFGRYHG